MSSNIALINPENKKPRTLESFADEVVVVSKKSESGLGWYSNIDKGSVDTSDETKEEALFNYYNVLKSSSIQTCAKNIRSHAAGLGIGGRVHPMFKGEHLEQLVAHWIRKELSLGTEAEISEDKVPVMRVVSLKETKAPLTPKYSIQVKIDIESRSILAQDFLKAVDKLYEASINAVLNDKELRDAFIKSGGSSEIMKPVVFNKVRLISKSKATLPQHQKLKPVHACNKIAERIISNLGLSWPVQSNLKQA